MENKIVSFVLRGIDLEPEFWTAYFGIEPIGYARRGHEIYRYGRSIVGTKSRSGFWDFSLSGSQLSLSVDDQTREIARRLNIPSDEFSKIAAEREISIEVWIFVDNSNGSNSLKYSSRTEDIIIKCGAKLVLDVYQPDQSD
jgi:hypothetical protein